MTTGTSAPTHRGASGPARDVAIRASGIRKSFGTLDVLRGVDLAVAPGTIHALLGSNGPGKTTLVRILATLLRADAGTATVAGHDTVRAGAAVRAAMSLVGNPRIIVLDEPTTGLDPQARQDVWDTIEGLARAGTTILLTTQYLEEAERLADRISVLHGGTIIADGTLADLTALLPAPEVEYVEKQPSLEDVFLALVGEGARA
ncbi:ATP-binding cassette domain-containing protein [Brevibacterium samyangense]|uniref:ABC transporter domain-containing protein n=1 Tax=Brevibacterium samyangense TaxID=366888 RepID=A0ABP5EW74_9MICO